MSKQACISDIRHSGANDQVFIPHYRLTFYAQLSLVYQELHQSNGITIEAAASRYGDSLNSYLQTLTEHFCHNELQKEYYIMIQQLYVWELCKILFFTPSIESLSSALMYWYGKCNSSLRHQYSISEIQSCSKGPRKHKNFWACALQFALFGQLDELAGLLDSAITPIRQQYFMDLLQDFVYLISEGYNLDHLEEMLAILKHPDYLHPAIYHDAAALTTIISILAGDVDAILGNAIDGPHAFILYHYYQPVEALDLQNVFETARGFYERVPSEHPDIFERLLQGNIYEVIALCSEMDWWLLAHLVDLFMLQGKLDRPIVVQAGGDTVSLPAREYFVLFYASALVNKFEAWQLAFEYMLTCDEYGRDVMIEHLKTMNLNKDDQELNRLVEFCIDNNLRELGYTIYETKANECVSSKDFKRAIDLYKKANLDEKIDSVFYEIIADFSITGTMYDHALIGDEEYSGLYYTVYNYFWKMHSGLEKGDQTSAANAFKELINNVHIPNTIIVLILWEGLKLVEELNVACIQKSDILKVKKLWQTLNKQRSTQDFTLFHDYIKKDEYTKKRNNNTLLNDMMMFLDTTGVFYARALDAADSCAS